jgi:hypothetical protein
MHPVYLSSTLCWCNPAKRYLTFFLGKPLSMDPYQELGVGTCASLDEIKAAFRERARQCHPDKVCTAAVCLRSACCIPARTHARTEHERTHAGQHARTHARTHECKHAHTHTYMHHGRSLASTHLTHLTTHLNALPPSHIPQCR